MTASSAARKAGLLRSFLAGRPVLCTWQLSPRCESFCHFCDHRAESAALELDLAGCRRVAEELGRMGTLVVSLSGSDPFLREDLPAVIEALARHHFPVLTTHGWLATEARARAVWEAGLQAATVVLHHAEPGPHDAVTGLPGSHARALSALAAFARTRVHPAQRVSILTRVGGGGDSAPDGLGELAARHGASLAVEPQFPLAEGAVAAEWAPSRRPCQAGRAFFNLDHRGRASKCVEHQEEADRLGDLLGAGEAALRPRLRAVPAANDCRACWSVSRRAVEGLYTVRGFLEGLATLVRA